MLDYTWLKYRFLLKFKHTLILAWHWNEVCDNLYFTQHRRTLIRNKEKRINVWRRTLMSEQHNLKEQLCFSLYNAQRQVNRYYSNKVFKKYNLTYPQFLVLSILWEESPVNVKKVVTELALDTGTVSPLSLIHIWRCRRAI